MLKSIYKSSLKLLFAGKGLSFRTGKYFGESMLVGLAVGLVVVAFRCLIDFVHANVLERGLRLEGPSRLAILFLPAVGAVIGYFVIKWFSNSACARGTDSAIRAYHRHGGHLPGSTVPVKSVASAMTVGFGGSAGYEGPVTLIGAACGSVIARHLALNVRARRILMAAGLAAGISAIFQAPLAGALFGFEIFYSSSDIEYETLLPSFIASAVGYTVFAYFFGWGSLFTMPSGCVYENGLRLLPYFALAIAVVFGARFYMTVFRAVEERFSRHRASGAAKVAIGGLVTGVIGFFVPDVLGTSYPLIQAALSSGDASAAQSAVPLTAAAFLCFFFLKAVATAFTVGSGGSGGVFAPSLVCGGAIGAAVGIFFAKVLPPSFGIHPAAFALVGMAGFLASAVRVPMTAIVIVSEISGNHGLLLPAMWVCGIAFWLNNGWTLYRSQPHSRESSPLHS